MTRSFDTDELDRKDAIVAHEAIVNLLVNDWSAMSKTALRDTERALSRSLDREPEYPEDE